MNSIYVALVLLPLTCGFNVFREQPLSRFKKYTLQSINGRDYLGRVQYVDADECAGVCLLTPLCRSFEYKGFNKRLCDLSNVTRADHNLTPSQYKWDFYELENPPEKEIAALSLFQKTALHSVDQHDYLGRVTGVNPAQCAAICILRDGCRSFEYKASRRFCDLSNVTSALYELLPSKHKWDFYELRADEYLPLLPDKPDGFVLIKGASVNGGEIVGTVQNASREGCADRCFATDGCSAFQFDERDQKCDLISASTSTHNVTVSTRGLDLYLTAPDINDDKVADLEKKVETLGDIREELGRNLTAINLESQNHQFDINNVSETTAILETSIGSLRKALAENGAKRNELDAIKNNESLAVENAKETIEEIGRELAMKRNATSQNRETIFELRETVEGKQEKVQQLGTELVNLQEALQGCQVASQDMTTRRNSLRTEVRRLTETLARYRS